MGQILGSLSDTTPELRGEHFHCRLTLAEVSFTSVTGICEQLSASKIRVCKYSLTS